jgi:hypothetical protein
MEVVMGDEVLGMIEVSIQYFARYERGVGVHSRITYFCFCLIYLQLGGGSTTAIIAIGVVGHRFFFVSTLLLL